MTTNSVSTVFVTKSELRSALSCFAPLARSRAKLRAAQFVMGPAPGGLELIGPGIACTIAARGTWRGRATFPASLVIANIKVPPEGDPVTIRTDSSRLWIGRMSMACIWRDLDEPGGVDPFGGIPKPGYALEALEIAARHGAAALHAQGFSADLLTARAWQRERIKEALLPLSELGVSYDDLAGLVASVIERRTQR